MSTSLSNRPATNGAAGTSVTAAEIAPVVRVDRRRLDGVLIGFGVLATAVFAVAGGLLSWGSDFAGDYVRDELTSQNIVFPPAQALNEDGRSDLAKYGGATVDTGKEAEAYASYINGHLQETADGATYADLGAPERAAKTAVSDAKAAGKDEATVAELQAKADSISNQRNTLFKGETLRGLLLTAFAWSTVGRIAGYAAWAAYLAAALMAALVVAGVVHRRRLPNAG